MGFVNEYISPEDVEKYGIKQLYEGYFRSAHKPDWTVDRERDIYLGYMCRGREEFADEWTFVLYWRGRQIEATLKVSGGGKPEGEQWRHYRLLELRTPPQGWLPNELGQDEVEAKGILKEALVAFRDFGVRSDSTKHTVTFDF